MSTTKTKTVEIDTTRGACGMLRGLIVIDHPETGRVLLAQTLTGMDDLRGGAYRWTSAYRLLPDDTIEALRGAEWNESTSLLEAVEAGADPDRPVLSWSPGAVAKTAADAIARGVSEAPAR